MRNSNNAVTSFSGSWSAFGTGGGASGASWGTSAQFSLTGSLRFLSWTPQGLPTRSIGNASVASEVINIGANHHWVLRVEGGFPQRYTGNPNSGGVPWVEQPYNFNASFSSEYAGVSVQVTGWNGTNSVNLGSAWTVPAGGGINSFAGLISPDSGITRVDFVVDDLVVGSQTVTNGGSGFTNSLSLTDMGSVSALIDSGQVSTAWRLVDQNGRVVTQGTNTANPFDIVRSLPGVAGQSVNLEVYVQPFRYQQSDGTMLPVSAGTPYWTNTGLSGSSGGNLSGYWRGPTANLAPSPLSTNSMSTNSFTQTYSSAMTNRTAGVPSYASGSSSIVTNTVYTNSEALVSNTITAGTYTDQDDGETNALSRAQGLLPKLKEGIDGYKAGYANLQSALEVFMGIAPGNVGRTCTFQVGPYALDLANVAWIREAAKYLVFLWAIAAMLSQMSRLWT